MSTPQRYSTGRQVRRACRKGDLKGCTSGLAPGYEQANLSVLPQELARDFEVYCQRNPKACPLLDVTQVGDPLARQLGEDCAVTTDLPTYLVHTKDGGVTKHDILQEWSPDSVAFLTGCSFTFEEALQKAGIEIRHIEQGVTVPMYITNRPTVPSGPFSGPLVVSMRPFAPDEVQTVSQMTEQFPRGHGAPVHYGNPTELGIPDLDQPQFGSRVTLYKNEVPVFWACGVTTQLAIKAASPSVWMSHHPGCMLVTDLRSESPLD